MVDSTTERVESRSFSTTNGVLCVMMNGGHQMRMWYAVNSDTLQGVVQDLQLTSGGAQFQFCWTTLGALATRGLWNCAPIMALESITVGTKRMQAWSAQEVGPEWKGNVWMIRIEVKHRICFCQLIIQFHFVTIEQTNSCEF